MVEIHEYEELPASNSIYMHLGAGAAAGIMEHVIMYPFDSIKTRMQLVGTGKGLFDFGLVQSFRVVTTTEGLRALWRGIGSMVLGAGPAHALYFATYEHVKDLLTNGDDSKMNPVSAGIAGGVGTILSDMLMNPFDGNFFSTPTFPPSILKTF
ncbi:Mitochondrial RNA-splicing protein MRS3 [Smittium mucronatum]|uniref:Mitochondrial RNA-splicing protein MRS3 n=1 Tax=Smittium mucronatum TaxID=133383 RepID=A0A1R0H341_9FUNG|nr:Mitochondrial RNA-splicing protein MRS3 [Smittium mucronatum]